MIITVYSLDPTVITKDDVNENSVKLTLDASNKTFKEVLDLYCKYYVTLFGVEKVIQTTKTNLINYKFSVLEL